MVGDNVKTSNAPERGVRQTVLVRTGKGGRLSMLSPKSVRISSQMIAEAALDRSTAQRRLTEV
jgi:hypothetical protein